MIDKIVELENNKNYVILDETSLNNSKYYFGLRLDENDELTNNYLFFEEFIDEENTYLIPVNNNEKKGILLTAFTVNFLDKAYDEV
ncbi:MAG: hypothetical protein IJO27_03020 [Bacilli bacterium]|nr:hypothetical protein [Bacilli bacterium]